VGADQKLRHIAVTEYGPSSDRNTERRQNKTRRGILAPRGFALWRSQQRRSQPDNRIGRSCFARAYFGSPEGKASGLSNAAGGSTSWFSSSCSRILFPRALSTVR
jgi:hypothetical protein